MAFVKNHAYGEEVLGKGTIRSQTINKRGVYCAEET